MHRKDKNLVIRCDAGRKYGLGHLSRCISLLEEFGTQYLINFVIKTDDRIRVEEFLSNSSFKGKLNKTIYIQEKSSSENDIKSILEVYDIKSSFLILDHYEIDKNYQEQLKINNIKWLQFDSHGKIEFLADFVLHASPAATNERYQQLKSNPSTVFLLGSKYAIVNKKFRKRREKTRVRKSLKNMLICFGGGDDGGTTLEVIKNLDWQFLREINVQVILSSSNIYLDEVRKEIAEMTNINLILDAKEMEELIAIADLGIIAPGTLSYEAACLGLPMVLIPFADNQMMNAKGWVDIECALSPGSLETFDKQSLQMTISTIDIEKLSMNCLKSVDGMGAKRVVREINNFYKLNYSEF